MNPQPNAEDVSQLLADGQPNTEDVSRLLADGAALSLSGTEDVSRLLADGAALSLSGNVAADLEERYGLAGFYPALFVDPLANEEAIGAVNSSSDAGLRACLSSPRVPNPEYRAAQKAAESQQALYTAIRAGDVQQVQAALVRGALLHFDHEYPLSLAAEKGQVTIMRLLMDAGADLDAIKNSIFPRVITLGHVDVVRWLLKNGADPVAAWNKLADPRYFDSKGSLYQRLFDSEPRQKAAATLLTACADLMTAPQRAMLLAASPLFEEMAAWGRSSDKHQVLSRPAKTEGAATQKVPLPLPITPLPESSHATPRGAAPPVLG